jgi:hypothetical protein
LSAHRPLAVTRTITGRAISRAPDWPAIVGDQDGTTAAVHAATTLFVIKDANHDVHLAPYHFWNRARDDQADLFPPAAAPGAAECRTTDSLA